MKKIFCCLLVPLLLFSFSCSSNSNAITLHNGCYVLDKIETEGTELKQPSISFASGTLVINNDSINFPGFKSIGKTLLGYNTFQYELKNKKLTLSHNTFKKTFDIDVTQDSLLRVAIHHENIKNIYFKPQNLNLTGYYKINSYTRSKKSTLKSVEKNRDILFNTDHSFVFKDENTATIDLNLVRYILKNTTITDTVFNVKKEKEQLTFSNAKHSFTLPYFYDGVLHLYLNDRNFEKIDVGKIHLDLHQHAKHM